MPTDYREINKNRIYCNADVYSDVAERLGVSEKVVEDIFNTQSEFTLKIIGRGGFESITYVYLGKMQARLKAIPYILDNPRTKSK